MKIPLVDLKAQHESIREEVDAAMASVIRDTAFVGGPYVKAFEKEFADFCGVRFAIGVSNGTDALRLALLASGIGPGDEVITVPNTFIATAEAIGMIGARVKFVDVDPVSSNMDPHLLEAAVTPRTRAIIPVHLYGRPADMDPLLEFARKKGLRVIADAAQAHGATYKGKAIASLGDAVCFSFYPGKNLGAYGDAGAVVTNDEKIARKLAALRDHGRAKKYEHDMEGFNCRLDGLQAAILSAKLPHLAQWTEQRRKNAELYREFLSGLSNLVPPAPADATFNTVFHLFVVRTPERDALQKHLGVQGISSGIHYPIPLHRQKAYAHLNLGEGNFPVAEKLSREILSLPLYPELRENDIRLICDCVRHFLAP